jgi:transposase InsO family protein
VLAFIAYWQERTGFRLRQFLGWLALSFSKYYHWKARQGQPPAPHAPLPKGFWLLAWEKQAIIVYYRLHPEEGYRRLTFMMLDENVVAVSPSSVYRVLKGAGLLVRASQVSSRKGKGFEQPLRPHQHWHVDVSYLNICGTFYYLCALIDGYSRYVVHWELRERMTEADIEIIIQRARERFPGVNPRIISDNGPQFIARDFKEFIRLCGMTHVRTSPCYPQSNGKIERWYQSLKKEAIRPKTPTSLEEARQVVAAFVEHYNHRRLHSAIGYIAPADKLHGRDTMIFQERKRKLTEAQLHRAQIALQEEAKQAANL